MATSGYKDVSVASYITLRYSWTAGTQNIAKNYTPISWKLQLISSNSSANINSSASKDYTVTTDGSKKTGTNTVGLSGGATKTLASGSKNIYHDSDGTCTFNYSFSQEFAITYSGKAIGTISGSGTGTLNTIPRKSVLGTISNFTIGNAINIPITKYSSSFTDTLTIKLGSTTIKTISSITNGYDVPFTTAELNNIYSLLPSATKGTFTFTLTTKSGTTTIGSVSKTAVGTIKADIKPSISSIALSEAAAGINAQFGGYVQSRSKIKGTVTAAAGNGSSIATYKTVINGNTYTASTFTTGVLKTSGSNTYTTTVKDKRGRTATKSGTFTVIAYSIPKITEFEAVRCLADGTEDVTGEYVKINASSSITAVNNKNSKSFKIEYKKKTDTVWTTLATYTGGYTYTLTDSIQPNFSGDSPYNFRITAVDFFHSAIKTESISTAYALIDFKGDGTGIAFGKVSTESDVLDIGYRKAYIPAMTYVGGDKNHDDEKNIYFKTTDAAEKPSNCKLYGGSGTSTVGIGMFDVGNERAILRYFPDENRLDLETNLIWHNSYIVEAFRGKTFGAATGRIHYESGLLMQWGTVTITPVANTPTSAKVTFPLAYDSIPNIQVSGLTSVPGFSVTGVGHSNDSASSTDIYVTRTTTTPTVIRWYAIGFRS